MSSNFTRRGVATAVVAVFAFLTAGNAAAAVPDRFTIHVDDTFWSRTSEDPRPAAAYTVPTEI